MITLKSNNESIDFANVAEVFNKNGENTSREFRNKLFGSWLVKEYDSAIKIAETVKERISIMEIQLQNLNTLKDALKPEIANEQHQLNLAMVDNMDATQLDDLESTIQQRRAKLNS